MVRQIAWSLMMSRRHGLSSFVKHEEAPDNGSAALSLIITKAIDQITPGCFTRWLEWGGKIFEGKKSMPWTPKDTYYVLYLNQTGLSFVA